MAGGLPVTASDGAEDDGLMAEINVTPLVDVVLVLLVIFMVTAPMLASSLDVKLPKTSTAKAADSSTVIVTVGSDGQYAINGKLATLQEVLERAKAAADGGVLIRGDASAAYGKVVSLLDELRRAGVAKAGLVTDNTPETGAGPEGAGR